MTTAQEKIDQAERKIAKLREIRENLATNMDIGFPQGRIQSMVAMLDEVYRVAEGLLDNAKSTQATFERIVRSRADGDQSETGTEEQ